MKVRKKRRFVVLHGHGSSAPKGRRSYIKFKPSFKNKALAKKWAKERLTKGSYKYVPLSKVKKTNYKSLFYIKK